MRSVGLKVLKNRLSEYVRLAAGGETVLVTDRSRVVAEIVPPQPGRDAQMLDAFVAHGMQEGWLTPAKVCSDKPPPRKPAVPFDELMSELQRDREDR
jgi:antitoxin (DNA-binding transcriptional repressor) of toxin-antitoxin stability system